VYNRFIEAKFLEEFLLQFFELLNFFVFVFTFSELVVQLIYFFVIALDVVLSIWQDLMHLEEILFVRILTFFQFLHLHF